MKLYFWPLYILFLLNSCVNKKETNHEASVPIEVIIWDDLSKKETSTFPASNLVKNIKYIKLDSSEKYLFGAADKILFLDKIYVLDRRLKKIVVFDQKGIGLNVLDKVGQGPEEYVQITDFSVDNEGNIHIIDGSIDKLVIYSRDYKFVSSVSLPFEADIIHCLDNDKMMLGLSSWNTKKEANRKIIVVDKELNVDNSFLSYDEYIDEKYWISYYSFISDGSSIFYNKPIDDHIYMLSDDGLLEKAFYVDFGTSQIPYDWRKDIEINLNKIREKYKSLKNHTIITEKYIIGTIWDKTETKPFLIDRKDNVVYLNEAIAESDVSDFVDYQNNSIISLIYPGKYNNISETDFPTDVKEHLTNENFVVCITELL